MQIIESLNTQSAASTIYPKRMFSPVSSSGESLDEIHLNRALLVGPKHEDLGNLIVALEYYQDLLKKFDHHSDVFFRIGNCYHQMGQLDLAASNYLNALSLKSDHQEALTALRLVRDEQAMMGGAYGSLVENFTTLAKNPLGNSQNDRSTGQTHHFLSDSGVGLANTIWDQLLTLFISQSPANSREKDEFVFDKFLGSASACFAHTANEYRMLVELSPGQAALVLANIQILNLSDVSIPESLFWIGNDFLKAYNQEVAIIFYNKAHEFLPENPELLCNLGLAKQRLGLIAEAAKIYEKILRSSPRFGEALSNLGTTLYQLGDSNKALPLFRKALDTAPTNTNFLANIGMSCAVIGDFHESINAYLKALSVNPFCPDIRTSLARSYLMVGDYGKGWNLYESRMKSILAPTCHASISPTLTDFSDLKFDHSDPLLILGEGGFGDIFHFMRYCKHIRKLGANTAFCVRKPLHGLVSNSEIVDHVLAPEEADNFKTSNIVRLLSLPKILGVSKDNPLELPPYIKTKPEYDQKWYPLFSAESKPIIGIQWQGSPRGESSLALLRGRSIELEKFKPIADAFDIKFLSLQKGFGSEALPLCGFSDQFVSFQEKVNQTWDFLEIASILKYCDLVIACDSGISHLSGALNKPTWLLLKHSPCWRWGPAPISSHSFWYPSMRLFRQRCAGDWSGVIHQVVGEMNIFFSRGGDSL